MRVNIKDVENKVTELVKKGSFNNEFIFGLLLAYGKPSSSITRLKSGTYNLAKDKHTEIYWKNNLYFKYVEHEDLHSTIDDLKGDQFVARNNPRFIIVTDFKQLLSIDTKTGETLDIPINEIDKHTVFFLPWAGMEKSAIKTENIADIRAAERMAKLYDEIIKHNDSKDSAFYHALNVFFSRLLFCFFAEDTEVFQKGQFTNSIGSHTQKDGSDLNEYLDELFQALDVETKDNYPSHIKDFPYVNGGLFNQKFSSPLFNSQARKLILECGELDWAQINPDIFGSMIQAVVHPAQRAGLGMHYTSVVNIMKVIEPLFLEELLEEFDKSYDDKNKLQKLLTRLSKIKVFDPACGSGNFLIIAYKELRKLEHKIIERINELNGGTITLFQQSCIHLENFYGIEIDDFAHEVAILSLWLAKHQMNIEFKTMFNIEIPLIPLKDSGNITQGNATRLDWGVICTPVNGEVIYLLGNPPYLGARNQKQKHKDDMHKAFADSSVDNLNSLDYIFCWIFKGSEYVKKFNATCAFVSTNSVSQGEQVSLFWPLILTDDIEIGFAHTSFKWTNNAKHGAGVACVIIGLRKKSAKEKLIISDGLKMQAQNISPYLTNSKNIYVYKRTKALHSMPDLVFGNQAIDGGHLIVSNTEKEEIVASYPEARQYLRRLYGADDFLKGTVRWCVWINHSQLAQAIKIPMFRQRFKEVKDYREDGGQVAKSLVDIPYRFRYTHEAKSSLMILPRTTSESRDYLPIGFLDSGAIVTDAVQVIYDPEPYTMGVLSSRLHMLWTRAVSGRLESRIRYSNTICYNNFPIGALTDKQKQMITNNVFEVLDIRERYSEKSLAELYKPQLMPSDLLKAHQDLDEVVERCYRTRPFENDEERLSYLFKLYETMIIDEQEKK